MPNVPKRPVLYATLNQVKDRILAGETEPAALEHFAKSTLAGRGWEVDYVSVRKQLDLHEPTTEEIANKTPLVVLAAAKLGATRLIDNLEIGL